MGKNIKVLLLTDHETHSKTDSIFRICEHLHGFNQVYVASRGDIHNSNFFAGKDMSSVFTKKWNGKLTSQNGDNWFSDTEYTKTSLFIGIVLRIDPPLNGDFLNGLNSHFDIPIINSAKGIELVGRRDFLLRFSSQNLIPKSEFHSSISELADLIEKQNSVVKLDESYGGKGVRRYVGTQRHRDFLSDTEFQKLISKNIKKFGGIFSQEYFDTVSLGDRRVIVSFGNPVGIITRIPAESEWRSNVSQGASISVEEVTTSDCELVSKVDPLMRENGIFSYGIDCLTDNEGRQKISEINVTNVGGYSQCKQYSGVSAAAVLAEDISLYFQSFAKNGVAL